MCPITQPNAVKSNEPAGWAPLALQIPYSTWKEGGYRLFRPLTLPLSPECPLPCSFANSMVLKATLSSVQIRFHWSLNLNLSHHCPARLTFILQPARPHRLVQSCCYMQASAEHLTKLVRKSEKPQLPLSDYGIWGPRPRCFPVSLLFPCSHSSSTAK